MTGQAFFTVMQIFFSLAPVLVYVIAGYLLSWTLYKARAVLRVRERVRPSSRGRPGVVRAAAGGVCGCRG